MKVNRYNVADNELAYIHSLSCSLIFFKPFEFPPKFIFQFLQMILGFVLICFAFSVNSFSIECTVYFEFKTK